jgi:hypothetical protein
MFYKIVLTLFFLAVSCSDKEAGLETPIAKGEYIYRLKDEFFFIPEPPEKQSMPIYPWEEGQILGLPHITKEYFRCKGSSLNPVRINMEKGDLIRFFDCGGTEKHSLPLRDNKEFIYPILIDLMNFIQSKTGKRIVITCGHRCPQHHVYADPSIEKQSSKHMIGAEVSFYVQGLEDKPENIVKIIQSYYVENPKYKEDKAFLEFQRYEKENTDVSTQPWFNKEIFIKLYKKKEGRNFDNRHPYPYISIQVRYDIEKEERVSYSWDKAFKNYLRK